MMKYNVVRVSCALLVCFSACIEPPPVSDAQGVDEDMNVGLMLDMGEEIDAPEERGCDEPSSPNASGFHAGDGTKEAPYIICGPEQLAMIDDVDEVEGARKHYTLGADIVLGSAWKPIRCFKGVLDGAGHELSGVSVNSDLYARVSDTERFVMCNGIAHPDRIMGGVINELQGELSNLVVRGLELSMDTVQFDGVRAGGVIGVVKKSASLRELSIVGMKATYAPETGGVVQSLDGGAVDGLYIYSSDSSPIQVSGALGGAGVAFGRIGSRDMPTMLSHIVIHNVELSPTEDTGERPVGAIAGVIDSGYVTVNRAFVSSTLSGSANVKRLGGLVGGVIGTSGRELMFTCDRCAVEFSNNHHAGSIDVVGGLVGALEGSAMLDVNVGYIEGDLVAQSKVGALVGERRETLDTDAVRASNFSVRANVDRRGAGNSSCVVGGSEELFDADKSTEFISGDCAQMSTPVDYESADWTREEGCLISIERELVRLGLASDCSG